MGLAHRSRPSKIFLPPMSNCPRRPCLRFSHRYRNSWLVVMIKHRANLCRRLIFLRSFHRNKQIRFNKLIKKVKNLHGNLFFLSLQIKVVQWKHHRLLRLIPTCLLLLLLTCLLICWSHRPARTWTISFRIL